MEPRDFLTPVQSRDSWMSSKAKSCKNQIELVGSDNFKWWKALGKD